MEWITKARFDGKSSESLKNHNAAKKKKQETLAITPTTNISFFIRISILMTYSLFYTDWRMKEMMVMLRL